MIAPASTGAAGAMQKVSTTVGDMTSGGGPKLQAMVGAIVREPIYAGEPITAKVIIRAGDSSYMAVRLPEGHARHRRAGERRELKRRRLHPARRPDRTLLSTHSDNTGHGGGMITETVLANALVLAIDQKTDTPKNGGATMVGATLTLEVPAASANSVAKARTQGGLTMALRSYADMAGKTVAKPSDAEGQSVRIFRGGSAAETVSAP